MRAVRNRRGMMIAVVAGGLGQGIVFPGAARAGFFDFLFGQPPQTQAVRHYEANPGQMPGQWGAGQGFHQGANRRVHRHERKAAGHGKLIVADRIDHPVRPPLPVDLMDDDSLRKGDAVMMPAGIRIFAGHSGDHHEPEDFRKLSEIKGLPKRERNALAALDAQGSGAGGKPGLASGRSASELKLVPGETVTDTQGRAIRYVGP